MATKYSIDTKKKDDKDEIIKKLEEELNQTENKLIELNRNLDQRVIERTVEINRLLRHKSKFIDNLSHDLATPITPLISLLPIIREEITKPKTKELMDICIRNVEYIKRVINNSRELADITATDIILKKENLYEIINELKKKYSVVFKSYNTKVQNNIRPDLIVKTDKNRLLQLFDHVTSNAINSMPEGGTLTFETKNVKKESGIFIQVSIKDTGVGLTREQTDRLFDEFYKTDDTRHKLDSTGLGLSICKLIVEKHGGKIWADSHGKGTGTTIYFTIPSQDVVFDRSF